MNTLKTGKPEHETDPVCGMAVNDVKFYHYHYHDKTYYFCSQHCQEDFKKHPDHFLGVHAKKRKSLWCRYRERLEKATGGSSMKCH